MERTLKTAVLGGGFVGRLHMEAIRRLGFVELCAIAESNGDKARQLAAEFGISKATTDYRDLLHDPDLDAVEICTPNATHYAMATEAIEAGKHVLCEKPLAISVSEAEKLTALAHRKQRRNCTFHNLRYYPMVEQMRCMCAAGELGEILLIQGTYFQDWLLHDTDWNWRLDATENGPSRCMADIGSHLCDMTEHVTNMRITSLCADLQTFHRVRRCPKDPLETFAGKRLRPSDYIEVPIQTEDSAGLLFRMGDGRVRGTLAVSQVSAGRKNRFNLEIYGTKGAASWNQECPNELWIGRRNAPNETILKDPCLLQQDAREFAALPGGHAEGYGDTIKQLSRLFYESIRNPEAEPEYPQFADGLRQLFLIEAVLRSSAAHEWCEVVRPPECG